MMLASRRFLDLTAADLMSRGIITIPQTLSVRAAAHCLAEHGVSGVPVVDETGRCVGVFTKSDVCRFLDLGPTSGSRPDSESDFFADWHVSELNNLPSDAVSGFMTRDVIKASPDTRIATLARIMHVEHVHRIFITDTIDRVVGVVSSMDILGAVAAEEDLSSSD